jgi:hypothetical protein
MNRGRDNSVAMGMNRTDPYFAVSERYPQTCISAPGRRFKNASSTKITTLSTRRITQKVQLNISSRLLNALSSFEFSHPPRGSSAKISSALRVSYGVKTKID